MCYYCAMRDRIRRRDFKINPLEKAWNLQRSCEQYGYDPVPHSYLQSLSPKNLQLEIEGLSELLDWCRKQPRFQAVEKLIAAQS